MHRVSACAGAVLLIASSTLPLTAQGGADAGRGAANIKSPAIVGRVVDSAGGPVPEVFVTALRPQPTGSRPFSFVSARLGSLTDARGEFRLDGLPLGPVYLVALPHNPALQSANQRNRSGYGRTFYPSATDVKDAKTVTVTIPGPAQVEIRLVPARLSVVSGTIIGAKGQPVARGSLGIAHGDGLFGLDSRAVPVRADGTFIAPALPPGTYHLQFRESAWPPARGEVPLVSGAKVIVAGEDVTGVRVMPILMVRATGRLLLVPATKSALSPAAVRVSASPVDFDGNPGPQQPGTVNADLTFEFRTWPSTGRIRVQLPPGWSVKAIRLNGSDVTDRPIDFVEGRVVSGLEIELTHRGSVRSSGAARETCCFPK